MRRQLTVTVYICLFSLAAWAQQEPFHIKGKIGNVDEPATIYLYQTEGGAPLDSSLMKNGRFEFTGKAEYATLATLMLNHEGAGKRRLKDYLSIYLHKGVIRISSKDSLLNARIDGSELNADNQRLEAALKPSTRRQDALFRKMEQTPKQERNTTEWKSQFRKVREELHAEEQRIRLDYIQRNPNTLISLFALQKYAGSRPKLDQIESLFAGLSKSVQNSKRGKVYAAKLETIKATSAGNVAPPFTLDTPEGTSVSLADFRGSYVLLEFWASWCVPCREENANLVKVYQAYKDLNFTILSVSVDRKGDREAWLKAIEDDQLVWTNVWDLKSEKKNVSKQYAVSAIPQNFLIDPKGNIVAKDLYGVALTKKLDELLD